MKINIAVVSTVDISMDEDYVKELITKDILAKEPDVEVVEINFNPRKNPARMDIDVVANYHHNGKPLVSEEQIELPLEVEAEPEVIGNAAVDNEGSAKAIKEATVVEEVAPEVTEAEEDEAIIETALDEEHLASLEALDSQFEVENNSVLDEIVDQAEAEEEEEPLPTKSVSSLFHV